MNLTEAAEAGSSGMTPAELLVALSYAGGCWAKDKHEPAEVLRSWKELTDAMATLMNAITTAEELEYAEWVMAVFSRWPAIRARHGW